MGREGSRSPGPFVFKRRMMMMMMMMSSHLADPDPDDGGIMVLLLCGRTLLDYNMADKKEEK